MLLNYFTSPMYVPSVAFAFVLLQVYSQIGGVPGMARVFIGHFIIILPYIVRNTVSVLHVFNWTLEDAATSLGANPVQQVKTFLEASILVQAGLGIAPLPEGMERNLSRDVSVFSIEGDSFRIRTVALRLPSVSLAGDHFFQLIREDQAAQRQRLQAQ